VSVGGTVDNGVDVGSGALVGVALGGLSVGGTVVGSGVDVGSGVLVGSARVAIHVEVARGIAVGLAVPVGGGAEGSGVEGARVEVGACAIVCGVAVAREAGGKTIGGTTMPRPTGVSWRTRSQAGGVMISGRSGSTRVLIGAP